MHAPKTEPAEFHISIVKVKKEIRFLQKLGFKVLFPVKTLPEVDFLKLIAKSVDGFDVSNAAEFKKISTFPKRKIGVTSPLGTDLSELNKISRGNAVVAVHNKSQLSRVSEFAQFALRLNPYSIANSPAADFVRFGIGKADLAKVPNSVFSDPKFRGFTAHFGWAITDRKLPLEFLKSLRAILRPYGIFPKILNLGGGWSQLSEADMKIVAASAKKLFPNTEIWIEPGERITQSAISVDAKIVDLTVANENIFFQLNCSVEAHLRWARVKMKAGFLSPKVPPPASWANLFISKPGNGPRIWFVGRTCSEGDRIGPFYLKSSVKAASLIGKSVRLENISGYALAWNREFNGVPKLNFRISAR